MNDEISEGEYQEGLADAPEPEPGGPLAQVQEKVEALPKKVDALTVAAQGLGDVLPLQFYQGNSELRVTEKEEDILKSYREAPDEDIEIRPEGLVYAQHMWYRNALTDAFGPGGWSLLPGSGIQVEKDGNRMLVFQRWVLRVHGAFIGEAIGSGSYWANNSAQDKSDASEAAMSNALTRICAKSSLGIGTNPWKRSFQREWRKKYAVQVYVKTREGPKKQWRRIDDDPFPLEIGPVDTPKQDGQQKRPNGAEEPKTEKQVGAPPAQAKEVAAPSAPAKVPPTTTKGQVASRRPQSPGESRRPSETKEPAPPQSSDRIGEQEWRYFMALARGKALITHSEETKADDAGPAYAWLCEHLAVEPDQGAGRTVIERLRTLYFQQTKQGHQEIVKALREKQ